MARHCHRVVLSSPQGHECASTRRGDGDQEKKTEWEEETHSHPQKTGRRGGAEIGFSAASGGERGDGEGEAQQEE